MIKKYLIFQPSAKQSIENEWNDCLTQISDILKDGYRPVKLNVFITNIEESEYLNFRSGILKSVVDRLGDQSPAVSVTVHPPIKPWKVTVEGLFLIPGNKHVVTRYYESMPYVVIDDEWGREVWGAGLGAGFLTDNARKAAENSFDHSVALLAQEGMTLNNIVRQWNYVGNILQIRNGLQNYQVFNEVRSEYYSRHRTVTGYPAATGIGMKMNSVIIDFCAISPDETVRIKGLSNPDQVNAYEYGQKVLKGIKDTGKEQKQPPQFERALVMAHGRNAVLYISGTASIKGQLTIGKNDVDEQTRVTIENIRKLTDNELIRKALGKGDQYSVTGSLLRVYIKHQKDFKIVKSICEELYPSVPLVFIEADVCRNDLLTEIEGEFQLQF